MELYGRVLIAEVFFLIFHKFELLQFPALTEWKIRLHIVSQAFQLMLSFPGTRAVCWKRLQHL